MKKRIRKLGLQFYDLFTAPLTFIYLPVLRTIRKFGTHKFPLNRSVFRKQGIYPIRDHYYDPQYKFSAQFDTTAKRQLAIDFRIDKQLEALLQLQYSDELTKLHKQQTPGHRFYLDNGSFEAGDAELYYLLIRNKKPRRIIEIGSGFTTLIALEAIQKNREEGHSTELIAVEPFEHDWLKALPHVTLMRKKVEELPPSFFDQLEEGDFLFIDSSHIIRPENDVLFEYLHVLPRLKKGVHIHIHDIFTPRHYPREWLVDECRLWNEQYLLEAFLYYNDTFQVLFSLNYLSKDYFNETARTLKNLTPVANPGSFWVEKVK